MSVADLGNTDNLANHEYDLNVNGLTTNNLFLQSPGGTSSNLNYYESASTPMIFVCGSSTSPTVNIVVVRVGNVIQMRIPSVILTFTTGGTFNSTGALPTRWRPNAQVVQFPVIVRNSGADVYGRVQINTNGTIIIGIDAAGTEFTAGQIGWASSLCVSYPFV